MGKVLIKQFDVILYSGQKRKERGIHMKVNDAKNSNWDSRKKEGPENAPCPVGEAARSNDAQPDNSNTENISLNKNPASNVQGGQNDKDAVSGIQYATKPVQQPQSMAESYKKFWSRDVYHADEESGKPIGTIF